MAKYRHRTFEMYDLRDESIRALTPKSNNVATDDNVAESWTFASFRVSRSAAVAHLQFNQLSVWGEETLSDLSKDFEHLAQRLGKDSRVLVDFTGVSSFPAAAIDALAQFKKKLRNQGSVIALCCLEPDTRKSFFPDRARAIQSDSPDESDDRQQS